MRWFEIDSRKSRGSNLAWMTTGVFCQIEWWRMTTRP